MLVRRGIMPQVETRGSRFSRADTIRRWATEGVRAYTSIQGEFVHISDRSNTVLDSGCWFGADKRFAGYTSEAAMAILKNQVEAQTRKGIALTVLDYYRKRFHVINMIHACEILTTLGCTDDTFYWGHDKWTPRRILCSGVVNNNTVHSWLAKDMRIQFIGGPPDKWNIFNGTLLSMMLDRIAVVVLFEGSSTLKNLHEMQKKYV